MRRSIIILPGLALLLSCGSGAFKKDARRLPEDPVLARLTLRMDRIGAALAKYKFVAEREETQGQVAPMEKVVVALSTSSKRKILVVAIGEEGSDPADINIRILSVDGATVAEDKAPDLRSAVIFWAAPSEEYLAEVSAKEGRGRFVLRLFSSSEPNASVALASLFDADPVRRRSFDAAQRQALALGFQVVVTTQKKVVRRGERVTFPMTEKSGHCYLFAATGSAGIDTLEVRLLQRDCLLSADFQSRPEAWVQHCAEKDQTVQALVKVQAGSGALTIGWFEASREEVMDIVGPPLLPVSPSPDLDHVADAVKARLISAGYIDIQFLADQNLTAGDRISFPLRLEEGKCASVLCVTEGLEDVDLEISKTGVAVALDRNTTSMPQTGICSDQNTSYDVAIIAIKGRGRMRPLISYLPEIDLPDLPDPSTEYTAREAAAEFKLASLTPRKEATLLAPNAVGEYRASIALEEGQCYGVAAITSSLLSSVRITASGSEPVASWAGRSPSAKLTLCPYETGEFSVEALLDPDSNSVIPYLLVFESGLI